LKLSETVGCVLIPIEGVGHVHIDPETVKRIIDIALEIFDE